VDRLLLRDMSFYGYHGDVAAERELGGRYRVDLEIGMDLSEAGRSDNLERAVDYVLIYQMVREVVEEEQHRLLESIAEAIAEKVLSLKPVQQVRVRVGKTPPVRGSFGEFAVDILRESEPGT
jgi:dihydroneopterin aldolase